jgi:hypothetical protein
MTKVTIGLLAFLLVEENCLWIIWEFGKYLGFGLESVVVGLGPSQRVC